MGAVGESTQQRRGASKPAGSTAKSKRGPFSIQENDEEALRQEMQQEEHNKRLQQHTMAPNWELVDEKVLTIDAF